MTRPRTYLDYNASAPLRPEARAAVLAALALTGNASSVHGEGRRVRAAIESARDEVARSVGATPSEIVFTSGATEANACVLAGGWDTIVLSGLEHESVLGPARASGARLVEVRACGDGVVDLDALRAAMAEVSTSGGRGLVTLQLANNETGALQPVAEAAAAARELGLSVHTDAVQALGRVPMDFAALGAAYMSLSSHKAGGPAGAGALVIRDGVELKPLVAGGGQERRRRAGTENAAAIAGFGAAASAATHELAAMARLARLRDALEDGVRQASPGAVVVGEGACRLPNTSLIAVPGTKAETLVIRLDLAGLAVSAGAACSSGKVGASHVLETMGLSGRLDGGAVRISIGHATEESDIAHFLAAWKEIAAASELAA